MGFPVPVVTATESDLPMLDRYPWSSMTASVAGSRPLSLIPPSITFSVRTAGRIRSRSRPSGRFTIPCRWPRRRAMSWSSGEGSTAISNNSKPVLGTDVKLHARPRRSPPTNAVLCPNSVFVTYVSSDHKVMDEAAISSEVLCTRSRVPRVIQ